MRTLIVSALIFASSTFADNCYKSVSKQFIDKTANYEYHHVNETFTLHAAKTSSFTSYDVEIKLGYEFPVISYKASNEIQGGYGAYEIVVKPSDCSILSLTEVYSE